MSIPAELQYTAEHEWVRAGAPATIGVTAVATDALGDIVFIELPEVGSTITAGTVCGEIESTKSVSELFAPVTGTVIAVNDAVVEDPALVNSDPYGAGWLLQVSVESDEGLLDATQYTALVG